MNTKLFEDQTLFTIVPDAFAILRDKRGVERQAQVYARGARLYAKHGSGYVCLHASGTTSNPDVRMLSLVAPTIELAPAGNVGQLEAKAFLELPKPRIATALPSPVDEH